MNFAGYYDLFTYQRCISNGNQLIQCRQWSYKRTQCVHADIHINVQSSVYSIDIFVELFCTIHIICLNISHPLLQHMDLLWQICNVCRPNKMFVTHRAIYRNH